MDRRSWLWRRKSPDKSPGGETESLGSLSSHSERFSDDQTLSNLITQSTEVTTKAASTDEHECSATIETLSKKLSAALLNIRSKEDLVKQHAKVAEEAVSGWERVENEVLILKKQNDSLMQKNSILEERAGHLDGALKECLRQLRQAREEQEVKICDAVTQKTSEWESNKSEFENQLAELHTQLQNAKTEAKNALSKLEGAENENLILRDMLLSRTKELELRNKEKDFSTHAAEIASKQHLNSVKEVAKLEAECRGLKLAVQKATGINNRWSVTLSSTHVEPIIRSRMDSVRVIKNDRSKMIGSESVDCELCCTNTKLSALATDPGQCRCERSLSSIILPVGIHLMDDFLAMERLAALPESHSGTASQDEGEVMVNRAVELEENLKKIKSEKENLKIALDESRIQLQASKDRLKQTEAKLVELKTQLALANEAKRNTQKQFEYTIVELQSSTNCLREAEADVVKIQDDLAKANEEKKKLEDKLTEASGKREKAESQLRVMDHELETLRMNICALDKELEKERIVSREAADKGNRLEDEISRLKLDFHYRKPAAVDEFRNNQDQEFAAAASKFAECQKTIASLGRQLKSLATFEDFLVNSDQSVALVGG